MQDGPHLHLLFYYYSFYDFPISSNCDHYKVFFITQSKVKRAFINVLCGPGYEKIRRYYVVRWITFIFSFRYSLFRLSCNNIRLFLLLCFMLCLLLLFIFNWFSYILYYVLFALRKKNFPLKATFCYNCLLNQIKFK